MCSDSNWPSSCNCDEKVKIGLEELELRRTEQSKYCDYPGTQMINYHQNNYPYEAPYNHSANIIFPKITPNPNIGFLSTYNIDFDDNCIASMEKENPNLPEPSSSYVSVENTATAKEAQSTSSECHTRTCLCCECQEKYGSLPLFAQVLDSQQQTTDVDRTCDERDGNETSQPSTSSSVQYPSARKPQQLQCDICQKRFSHRGDYHKHVRIHNGERPYACAFCPLRFAHPSNRARHLRSHSTERPYHCKECNRNFYRKDKLDRHRMSNRCRKRNERQDRS